MKMHSVSAINGGEKIRGRKPAAGRENGVADAKGKCRQGWKLGANTWEGNVAAPHGLELGLFDPETPLLGISTVVLVNVRYTCQAFHASGKAAH